jgi:hypothetical protein
MAPRKEVVGMVKMTVEVDDNVLKFLRGLCAFTGEDPKGIMEREIASIPGAYLGNWDGSLGVSAADLKQRYGV